MNEEQMLASLDMNYVLLEHYASMNLNEKELMVILMIDHLLKQNNNLLTADVIALKMTLPSEEIDQIVSDLIRKKMIVLEKKESGKLAMSLRPLKKQLFQKFQQSLYQSEEKEIANLYQWMEKKVKRTLSPVEVERIHEWLRNGCSEQDVQNAVKDLEGKGKRISLKAVDAILLSKIKSKDIQEEGYSTASEKWSKDVAETIALTKMKWVEGDD